MRRVGALLVLAAWLGTGGHGQAQATPQSHQSRSNRAEVNIQVKVAALDENRVSLGALRDLLGVTGAQWVTNETVALPRLPYRSFTNGMPRPDRGFSNSVARQFSGRLTSLQAQQLAQKLTGINGVTWLPVPEVTTMSGQRALIQNGNVLTVVTGAVPATGTNTSGINYQTEKVLVGLEVGLQTRESPDGFTFELSATPVATDFLGYDHPGQTAPASNGVPSVVVPLPRFRVGQLQGDARLYDGQTLLLGGLTRETVVTLKDKAPMLADIPLLGRAIQDQRLGKRHERLLIFIKVQAIHPDGSRIYSDDELPFDRNTLPPPSGERK